MAEGRGTYGVQVIADLLMITPRRVQQLVKEGVLPQVERGQYQLAPVVQAYIKYLQSLTTVATPLEGELAISLAQERARKAKADADLAEMEVASKRGNMIDATEMAATLSGLFATVKARLLKNAPKRIAARSKAMKRSAEIRAVAEEEMKAALAELVAVPVDELVRGEVEGERAA